MNKIKDEIEINSFNEYCLKFKLADIDDEKKKYNKWKKYMLDHINDDDIVVECCRYMCGIYEYIKRAYKEIEDEKEKQKKEKLIRDVFK
jgi:hypothetical protein